MRDNYHPLKFVEMNKKLSNGPKRLFRWVCEDVHYKIGSVVEISRSELGRELGRARPTVIEWEPPLVEAGLLEILEDEKNGTVKYKLLSFFPGIGWNTPPSDSQKFFAWAIDIQECESGCRERSTESDSPSVLVNETRQEKASCREPSTKPDSPHNISARDARCCEEEEEKLILLINSVTWDQVKIRFFWTWTTIYHNRLGMRGNEPKEEDRELILSATVLSLVLKDGKQWLKISARGVKNKIRGLETTPIQYFHGCLSGNLANYLGLVSKDEVKAFFGKYLRLVRPKVGELWRTLDQELANRRAGQEVKNPCNN